MLLLILPLLVLSIACADILPSVFESENSPDIPAEPFIQEGALDEEQEIDDEKKQECTLETTTPESNESNSTVDEIPLASGVTLIIEESTEPWNSIKGWIIYTDSEEPELLFDSWWGHYAVSPDSVRVMYFSCEYDHRGGELGILNVLDRSTFILEFIGNEEDYLPWNTEDFAVINFLWFDSDIILVIRALEHGSATVGGDVYFFDISSGLHRRIISCGEHFQISHIKIIGDELVLTAALDNGGYNFIGDFHQINISRESIFDAIQNDSIIVLDNIPDIRDN